MHSAYFCGGSSGASQPGSSYATQENGGGLGVSDATKAADEIIHAAVFDVGENAARALALSEAPWLGWPVISVIFDKLLNRFAGWIYEALDKQVTFVIIDIETEAQRKAYDS